MKFEARRKETLRRNGRLREDEPTGESEHGRDPERQRPILGKRQPVFKGR